MPCNCLHGIVVHAAAPVPPGAGYRDPRLRLLRDAATPAGAEDGSDHQGVHPRDPAHSPPGLDSCREDVLTYGEGVLTYRYGSRLSGVNLR